MNIDELKLQLAASSIPGSSIALADCVRSVKAHDGGLQVQVVLPFPGQGLQADLQLLMTEKLGQTVALSLTCQIQAKETQHQTQALAGVKNVIAVASGKGGVGKSTVSSNLAMALQAEGARVGILDADIYGPCQQLMFDVNERPKTRDEKSMEPVERYGIQTMSFAYLLGEREAPAIWRGPMAGKALQQILFDTRWHDLDYLIVDLPPGTGDIQLTLAQKVPIAGAVVVTTPQDIALIDAYKALRMFEKMKIHVLGIVENMSYHVCSQCGHQEAVFGEHGGEKMADKYQVPMLGQLPLDRRIRELADQGQPIVQAEPDSDNAKRYCAIARRMAAALSCRKTSYAHKFPNVVIEKKQ